MPLYKNYRFLVVTYGDLSSWVEVQSLYIIFLQAIVDFLWENVICQHTCFKKLVINEKPKNKNTTMKLAQRYKIKRVILSPISKWNDWV